MKSSMRRELCSALKPFSDETQRLGEFAVGGVVNYYFLGGALFVSTKELSCLISWCN